MNLPRSNGPIFSITCFLAVASVSASDANAATFERSTNYGIGADAEVRDWDQLATLGFASEMAVRINNAQDPDTTGAGERNDLMYIKIDLSGITAANLPGAIFRLSYGKDNQLTQGRVVDPGTGVRAGLDIFGLDVNDPGNSWDEALINYDTAPGLANDFQGGNRDFDLSKLTYLGNIDFPDIVPQNWFPVGGSLDLSGAALESFLGNAVAAGAPSVTFVAGLQHDGNPAVSGTSITNRTYLFVHKELLTLNDPAYDADTTDPNNPTGGPYHNASNANGAFSPRLVLQQAVPEPASFALLGVGLLAGWSRLRRIRG